MWECSSRIHRVSHVLGSDRVRGVVEIDKVAGSHVYRAHTETHLASIDPGEVDEPLEGRFEELGFIKAGRLKGAARVEPRGRLSQGKKAGSADEESPGRAYLVEDAACEVPLGGERVGGNGPVEQRVGCDLLPKGAQLGHPLVRGIPGDEGGVDGADRNAGDPIGMEIRFGERLVDAGLIRAERAAALQQQSNALERGPRGQPARPCEGWWSRHPGPYQSITQHDRLPPLLDPPWRQPANATERPGLGS